MAWTKPQRDRAKAENKALFEYRYKGRLGGMELAGVMDDRLAANLFGFVMQVYKGVPPSDAFLDCGLDAHNPVSAGEASGGERERKDD